MKYFLIFGLYITAIVGDAAAYISKLMERVFWISVAKIREIEDMGGAHERRTLRPAEVEQG